MAIKYDCRVTSSYKDRMSPSTPAVVPAIKLAPSVHNHTNQRTHNSSRTEATSNALYARTVDFASPAPSACTEKKLGVDLVQAQIHQLFFICRLVRAGVRRQCQVWGLRDSLGILLQS